MRTLIMLAIIVPLISLILHPKSSKATKRCLIFLYSKLSIMHLNDQMKLCGAANLKKINMNGIMTSDIIVINV